MEQVRFRLWVPFLDNSYASFAVMVWLPIDTPLSKSGQVLGEQRTPTLADFEVWEMDREMR